MLGMWRWWRPQRQREEKREGASEVQGEQENVDWPFAEGKLCNQSVFTPDESYLCKAGLLSQCSGFKFLPSPSCPLLGFQVVVLISSSDWFTHRYHWLFRGLLLKSSLIYFHNMCVCRGLSELELEEGVSHHMGSGDRIWVLCKISKYPQSPEPSLQPLTQLLLIELASRLGTQLRGGVLALCVKGALG